MNKNYSVRTDLAFESITGKDLKYQSELINNEYKNRKVTIKETIFTDKVAADVNKKPGTYYLVDLSECDINDTDDLNNIEEALTEVIRKMFVKEQITPASKCLIVGLGNVNVTPDSLGPLVIDRVIVTRHMFLLNPEEVSPGISNVSAIAPGVMGNTGIETTDIIQAVIKEIDVDYIIVVDALAASAISRVNKSIQITNTGISPGSGVGNRRKEISKETINKPVIAIGVPTVVDAVTIAANTVDYLLKYLNKKLEDGVDNSDRLVMGEKVDFDNVDMPKEEYKKHFLGEFGTLSEEEKASLFNSVLTPNGLNMFVTPKEVDIDIENLSEIISNAIDRAVHKIVH